MQRAPNLLDHPRLFDLVNQLHRDAVALGRDVAISDVDGILTIRVSLVSGPGFLGEVRE